MTGPSRARGMSRGVMALVAVSATALVWSALAWRAGARPAAWAALVLLAIGTWGLGALSVHRLRSSLASAIVEIRLEQQKLAVATALDIRASAAIANEFPTVFMPQTGFSMTASNLSGLLDLMATRKPKVIVELGSGFSTLIIAAWLKREGRGNLVSFDHEPVWAERCRAYLRTHSLDQYAEVYEAPLVPQRIGNDTYLWYDLQRRIGDIRGIDLLVVDGPPSRPGQMTRWPALPVLRDRFSKGAAIFVDDGDRRAERAMVEVWKRDFTCLSSDFVSTLTGYWVLRMGSLEDDQ